MGSDKYALSCVEYLFITHMYITPSSSIMLSAGVCNVFRFPSLSHVMSTYVCTFCVGDELIISDTPERFREMSCRAVCRIFSYFTIFVLCGVISEFLCVYIRGCVHVCVCCCVFIHCTVFLLSSDFLVSCFYLYHFSYKQFDIPVERRMALLGIQVTLCIHVPLPAKRAVPRH